MSAFITAVMALNGGKVNISTERETENMRKGIL